MLPNLIVIGAGKAGSTALHHQLGLHPDVQMSREKELDFFLRGPRSNWRRGRAWYESWFHGGERVHGESSPSYSLHPVHPGVPERMASLLPGARLVYLVRDPIPRMTAHWAERTSRGWETRPLAEALLADDENRYLAASLYWSQLERYLAWYPEQRILVLAQEGLRQRRCETLARVFAFLGVDAGFDSPLLAREWNPTRHRRRPTRLGRALEPHLARATRPLPPRLRYPLRRALRHPLSRALSEPPLSAAARAALAERLAGDVERLRRFTGERFETWSL